MFNKERMMYLTTTDNPYNPLIMYEEWDQYDRQKGYFTQANFIEGYERATYFLRSSTDRYYIDNGKAAAMAMLNLIHQDEFRKRRTDLRQILPENVHYRIVWEDEEPE